MERSCLADYADVRAIRLEEFQLRFPDPVLVVNPPDSEADVEEATTTGSGFLTKSLPAREFAQVLDRERAKLLVYPVKKKPTTFGDAIWIGRAGNCDVILPFRTISKVHAMITRGADTGFRIGDAGSKNGTFVEGRQLEKGKAAPLGDGASLSFGSLQLRFLLPASFHAELRRLGS